MQRSIRSGGHQHVNEGEEDEHFHHANAGGGWGGNLGTARDANILQDIRLNNKNNSTQTNG